MYPCRHRGVKIGNKRERSVSFSLPPLTGLLLRKSNDCIFLRFDPGGSRCYEQIYYLYVLYAGLGFYEMSGGADFVPEARPIEQIAISTTQPWKPCHLTQPQVTRAAADRIAKLHQHRRRTSRPKSSQPALRHHTSRRKKSLKAERCAKYRATA